jgi:hypothetical protein
LDLSQLLQVALVAQRAEEWAGLAQMRRGCARW